MPYIESIEFDTWREGPKVVQLSSLKNESLTLRTTVVTGRNGTYKSATLSSLAKALIDPGERSGLVLEDNWRGPLGCRVLCISASSADRFPLRDQAGRPTTYCSPRYIYFGQRVGANITSKRQPLETILMHALSIDRANRYDLPFFKKAFDLIGLEANINCRLMANRGAPRVDLLKSVQSIAEGREIEKRLPLNQELASWLLGTFSYNKFRDLDHFLQAKSRRHIFDINADGVEASSEMPAEVARLGLYTDLLRLEEAYVFPKGKAIRFGALELSAGEFHVLTTILGLGFAIDDDSVVLMDEPENCLHPQWQQDLVSSVVELCNGRAGCHLIISTHSPLVVGAAPPGAFIVDMERSGDGEEDKRLFGSSADRILLEQFDVASSRNPYVVEIVRRAVALVESDNFKGREFFEIKPELEALAEKLSASDPLGGVVRALLGGDRL